MYAYRCLCIYMKSVSDKLERCLAGERKVPSTFNPQFSTLNH